jgi:hypothetical protein
VQPVSIGIAGIVKPVTRPLFAKSRTRQQPVDKMFVSLGRRVLDKLVDLFGSRQQAG